MPALNLSPVLSLVAQISRQPAAPLRIWLRTAGYKLRPPRPSPYPATRSARQDAVLRAGLAGPQHRADILVEERTGPLPTIIVGGFVPDATEAFYLVRGGLLQHGSVYYFNYPRRAFSTDLFLAQLEDLIHEVAEARGRVPVLIGVSFGAGLVLELLRRAAARGAALPLAGLVLVSPVLCTADLLDPAAAKPTTLLGRVIKPYLEAAGRPDRTLVEKSRTVFLKMFEAGAQNKDAMRFLLTRDEATRLRAAVLGTINAIDERGATERVQALRELAGLGEPHSLFAGPALVLYSEKESAVLVDTSPTWRLLCRHTTDWFPRGRCAIVTGDTDNPVQHASLIFHSQNFQGLLAPFYRTLRQAQRQVA